MKILFVNAFSQHGGASVAARRLFCGVREAGETALFMARDNFFHDPDTLPTRGHPLMSRLAARISARQVAGYSQRTPALFSPELMWTGLLKNIEIIRPDIVHLHWVNGDFLSIGEIGRLGCPVVWTLHDCWAFTGGCHYPAGCQRYKSACGSCPVLGSETDNDLSRKVFNKKQQAFLGKKNISVITPSRWLGERCRESSLLGHARIESIPNGINTGVYHPVEKQEARKILGLPVDKKIVLFGAMNATGDPRKGYAHLMEAFQCLGRESAQKDSLHVLIFGASKTGSEDFCGFPVTFSGYLYDDWSLSLHYAAADVFVIPSREENLPNTIMEAFSCGTPVVGFKIGGIPEMIDHQQNGYLAAPFDGEDFARGILWVLENNQGDRRLSVRARAKVLENYTQAKIAREHLNFYNVVKQDV